MRDDVQIRRATRADLEAILNIVRTSLGAGTVPRTVNYWKWKHEANPFGPSPVLVAETKGQLVGLRAFMRWSWQSGGQDVTAVRAVDTATHPDWRGRGLFKRLTLQLRGEMAEEVIGFVFNTPNAQSRPGYVKMGWSVVGKPTLWVRPVRPVRLVRALYREGLGGVEGRAPALEALSVQEGLLQPSVQSVLHEVVYDEQAYHTSRTAPYLDWRYAQIPGFKYYLLAEGQGAGGALAVVRSRRRGALRELRICDLVAGPTAAAQQSAAVLLKRIARAADVEVVLALKPAGVPPSTFLAAGYLPAPHTGPLLTVYDLNTYGSPNPAELQSWDASIGDLELF